MVHLPLSRAHLIYAETLLTDDQIPPLVKCSSLHHGKQNRATAVPTNVPVLHELSLIHVQDNNHMIADTPSASYLLS
jgi:hypothetical protein